MLVYNETLSGKQFEYNIPDPCDHYNATVTAQYGYQNQKCLQNVSVQIFGGKKYYCNWLVIHCMHNNVNCN